MSEQLEQMGVNPKPRLFALFCDETNKDQSEEARYFIYGGVIVPIDKLCEVHNGIEAALKKYNFPNNNPLKFSSNYRPKCVSQSDFSSIKDEVVGISKTNGIKFIAYLVPHAISKNQGPRTTIEFGLNTVLQKFNQFLQETNSKGIVFVDRPDINNPFRKLAECFQNGLKYEKEFRSLENIICYSVTCSGASLVFATIDIILGGFGYCVNSSNENDMIRKFLPKVMRMMWGKREGRKLSIREYGLILRPTKMLEAYEKEAKKLVEKLIDLANRHNTETAE